MAKNEDLPLSAQWISKELLQETQELWSESYGRPISQDEAIEILFNVKRMGELLLRLRREAVNDKPLPMPPEGSLPRAADAT
jgi:hypothetical protein